MQELFASPPLSRILIQTLPHEVDALVAHQLLGQLPVDGVDHSRVRDAQAAKELVSLEYLHVSRDEIAEVLADQIELIHVGFARPKGLAVDQLHEDAAHGPNVHLGAVLGVANQELGGPVPTRGHVIREIVPGS